MIIKGGGNLVTLSLRSEPGAHCVFHVIKEKRIDLNGNSFRLRVTEADQYSRRAHAGVPGRSDKPRRVKCEPPDGIPDRRQTEQILGSSQFQPQEQYEWAAK